jgi:hypothetical protein
MLYPVIILWRSTSRLQLIIDQIPLLLVLSSLLLMTLPPLALRFSLTSFEPNVGFGTFFSPKRLALSAFHNASVAARPPSSSSEGSGWIPSCTYCTVHELARGVDGTGPSDVEHDMYSTAPMGGIIYLTTTN